MRAYWIIDPPQQFATFLIREGGAFGASVGGMDMVSLGPTIRGAHSPDERVYVASVERTWQYLVAVLAALCKSGREK